MKNKLSYFLLLLLIASISSAQNAKIKIDIPQGPVPWNNLNLNNHPATFQFAIVTDRTGGHRPGVFLDGVKKLNLLQPEFVMSVGDLIEGYTEDTSKLNWEWNQFNGFIDSLQMPFFYLPGNHDMTNKVMKEKWEQLFGRSYYHFIYKDVLFLCLNSEDNYRGAGRGTIDNEQYEYIEKVLKENKDVKWTLVYMHQPLWNQQDTKRWPDVEKLLEDRKHTVFVGHNHRYRKYDRNNGKYFILATTGGGSRLRGPNFGEFDHVVWVTMTDDGPIIANLLLEGIWDENVVTDDFAKITNPLIGDFPVAIDPIFLDENQFERASTFIKIPNSSDFELQAKVSFVGNKHFAIEPGSFEASINPNDVSKVNLDIRDIDITSDAKTSPVQMNVKLSYDLENRPDLELEQTFNIMPTTKYHAKSTKKKYKVDGKLNDWGDLEYSINENSYLISDPFAHKGDKDASANFSLRYNEDYLYIAANVMDDEIIYQEGNNVLNQDAILIFLDARPVDKSCMNIGRNLFSDWMLLALSPDLTGAAYRKNQLPEGVLHAVQKIKGGYVVEAAIPLSYLTKMQVGSWETFRFNIMINDHDHGGQHKSKISWKPLWQEQSNYVASGTFFKQ